MKTWRWAVMALLSGWMVACQPIDETGGTGTGTGTSTNDSAWVNVTNDILKDPGPVSLLLYAPSAADYTASSVNAGTVPENSTGKLLVQPGDWKLAFQDESGTVWPLTLDTGSTDWPVVQVTKDSTYQLILSTDAGNNDFWEFNIPVVQQ